MALDDDVETVKNILFAPAALLACSITLPSLEFTFDSSEKKNFKRKREKITKQLLS